MGSAREGVFSKPLRSEGTRQRILGEAKRLFAELGYEKTTIREVANAAEIHPSMVMRYYGSKEDLFAAAATIDFHMPDLSKLPPEMRGRALIEHVIEQWEGDATGHELKVLLRAAGTHELARSRFVDVVQAQSLPVIRKITAKDRQDERIGLILMQIAGLVVSRYLFAYGPAIAIKPSRLVDVFGPVVQQYLSGKME